jgi:1-acyl-sn-glycerol-3-phosphate acyltransferase
MKYLRAAIRMFAFFAASFALYGTWLAGSRIVPNKQYWRQIFFTAWSKFFVWLSGMTVDVIGDVPRPPFFLVSNHLSYTDIPVLRSLVTSIFVAKGEIRGWLLAGKIVSDMGMVFIDRSNKRDIPRAGDDILRRLEGGEGVIVFPEGTSSKGESILRFNSSFFEFAARTDLPIHYAAITYRVDDESVRASDSVCWWDDSTFLEHMFRFFQVRRSTAIVTFGSEPVTSPDRKELAERLWTKVNEHFVPVI